LILMGRWLRNITRCIQDVWTDIETVTSYIIVLELS
jgi:hypothetical protein